MVIKLEVQTSRNTLLHFDGPMPTSGEDLEKQCQCCYLVVAPLSALLLPIFIGIRVRSYPLGLCILKNIRNLSNKTLTAVLHFVSV
jgi:hypothetical protein